MSRRGTSSGGGASSLGYLFGSYATPLARPNNRAPPRLPQPPGPADDATMLHQQFSGCNRRQQQSEQAGDPPSSGSDDTPTSSYDTPSGAPSPDYNAMPPLGNMPEPNHRPSPMLLHQQSRAAGKVSGGMSLDMSAGSLGRHNNYFRADGQNSRNVMITDRRVQAAPGGGSSLGYLFGGA